MEAENLQRRKSSWVRLRAPLGLGMVQTFSGRRLTVSPDGTVDMSVEDADYLIGAGWTKIAEGVCEDKA
jgi:hypothetical protein